ncbi:hypothetical protein RJT34_33275 [Clitoria ternatea]|uniref:Oleosin n=1 Tax=Clitoria ternatea TaxID=43366 RepID=A0AAN9EXI6_CLITE
MADPQHSPTRHFIVLTTLVPFGATLLLLAALILTATVIGLTLATPLFLIFSPILLPAALVVGLAVAGFLTSGAFGITSLSSFAWLASYLRRSRLPHHHKSPPPDIATDQAADTLAQNPQETSQEAQEEAAPKAKEGPKRDQ